MAEFPIPEGYSLVGPINTKTAKEAIAEAVENGFPPESVLTRHDGFLVPLPRDEEEEEIEFDDTEWVVAHSPNPDRIGLIVTSPEDGEEDEEVVSREDFDRDAEERAAQREEAEAAEREAAEAKEREEAAAAAEAERVAQEEADKVAAEAAAAEAAQLPDTSWTNADIEKWASEQTPAIEVSGTKAEMLKTINDTLEVK